MAKDEAPGKIVRPVRWNSLRPDEAEQVIRERAGKTPNVIFSDHAFDRIEQRSITQADALTIIRQGHVEGDPLQTASGDWKVVVVRRMPGGRGRHRDLPAAQQGFVRGYG